MALGSLLSATLLSAQSRARLLEEARIAGAQIMLSDLVPATTDVELRRLAGEVRVGRAPLAGSVRVLTCEQLRALVPSDWNIEIPEVVIVHRTRAAFNEIRVTRANTARGLLTAQQRQTMGAAAAVYRGQSATLLVESDGIRISEQVIALGTATAGETVSAMAPASHRIVHAVVTGKGVLQLK